MFDIINEQYLDTQKKLANLKKKYDKDEKELFSELIALRVQRQIWCEHPTSREENSFDYHKREDWTTVYCTVCEKQLDKY